MLLTLALAAAASLAQPAPPPSRAEPAPLRTFRDWIVGCDNGHACEALALMPEGSQDDPDSYLQLNLVRGPERDAPLRLSWDSELREPAVLSVDGRVIATGVRQDSPLTRSMIDAMRRGASITLRNRDGGRLSASLAGISATMLAIDEVQGRVGSPTAAVRRGSQPMRAAVPDLPVIVRPAASPRPPRTMTVAQAIAAIGPDNASCEYSNRAVEPVAHRLDATHSLVLIDHPCGNGAYNYFTTAIIIDERGRASPARFDINPGMGPGDGPGNIIVGADYDAAARRIGSHSKGRGIGDCGTSTSYVWDGSSFALEGLSAMSECRLRMGFITIWRSTVR